MEDRREGLFYLGQEVLELVQGQSFNKACQVPLSRLGFRDVWKTLEMTADLGVSL